MTLTAALFVGGESRRMGTDKATLSWQGEPLWARQCRQLRELQPDALWISARTRPPWCPADIEVVLDSSPSRGPLSGLAAALARVQTTHLLALAIDLPHMNAPHLRKLFQSTRPRHGVIPVNGNYFETLCAIYPAEAAAAANELLAGDDASLQHLARILIRQGLLHTYAPDPGEAFLYQNLNTPAEFNAEMQRTQNGAEPDGESD